MFVFIREVGTVMRFLGAYPTEEQLLTEILPKLMEDEDKDNVKFSQFEVFMLGVMVQRQYEPDTEETLLQAFKV